MRVILSFCIVFASTFYAAAKTGFFLIIEKGFCAHPAMSLDDKQKYCIPEEPIIKESEFKTEGNLENDPISQSQFFNLRFTKSGFETLKVICELMPEKRLVFVVNGKAVGTYDSKNLKPGQVIQISDKAKSKMISWIFENLKKNN